jgi:hypothetical protein
MACEGEGVGMVDWWMDEWIYRWYRGYVEKGLPLWMEQFASVTTLLI